MSPNENNTPTLVVVTGPTGSGKTELSIALALRLGCHIVSADSRQIYKGLEIGTCAPTQSQLSLVPHHFVGTLELDAYYSAAQYEEEVLRLLPELWKQSPWAVMCGGSMMYVDAVTKGIDDLPTITKEIRSQATEIYKKGGLPLLRQTLSRLDPSYYSQADLNNHKRLIHAIEISWQAKVPYSSLRTGGIKKRDFRIVKMAINHPRQQLFERINSRVRAMIDAGLLDEARRVYPFRHLNSLNTVGYKELFACFDGKMDLETAIGRIAKNTRVYAKKQLTWMKKDSSIFMLEPEKAFDQAMEIISR